MTGSQATAPPKRRSPTLRGVGCRTLEEKRLAQGADPRTAERKEVCAELTRHKDQRTTNPTNGHRRQGCTNLGAGGNTVQSKHE